tara:strand:+ start:626 stop:2359 length:1734 start_codon:yes stop_codon:yes gene_type:complete
MSVLQKLTEGIQARSLKQEGAALIEKWEATGLLEGLTNDVQKNGMARLLENQAAQLLKESSSMSAGDVEGFASVAFPLVRRVFGGLVAQDVVSVQPMSLPSGLIFFLDFQATNTGLGLTAADSIYGGGVVGKDIQTGVTDITEEGGGFYNLNNGYASPTGSFHAPIHHVDYADGGVVDVADPTIAKLVRFDPDLASGSFAQVIELDLGSTHGPRLNYDNLVAIKATGSIGGASHTSLKMIRRLTSRPSGSSSNKIEVVLHATTEFTQLTDDSKSFGIDYPLVDTFSAGTPVGSVVGADPWGLEEANNAAAGAGAASKDLIKEIDIKVDSIAVTAMTKKLKAKWTPELGQDLNAYHNLDAEVELTSILSEQIALEIDQEILEDLVKGATAGTFYWSRSPGLFVNRTTGVEIGASSAAPDFTGTVSEWYETLIETINDVSAQIHRKTLRGGANFVVCGPEVANILEFTSGFRGSVTADEDRGTIGAVKTGNLSKKFDVYVDPYFMRNIILVGRKGNSFLESGYVYAPYVPLQVTPTIFGTEDFVPRKGVMTRYAKKMVRPDMYGLVVVRGLLGEAGATA